MSDLRIPVRNHVAIDGNDFLLDEDQDLVDLMARLEVAARSEGAFVHFDTDAMFMSVFVSSSSRVVVGVERVPLEALFPDGVELVVPGFDF